MSPERRAPYRAGNRENRRQALVEAALDEIAERGFEGLRTREVAAHVGLNVATLHYYFPTKEALIRGVLDEAMRRFLDALGELRPRVIERVPLDRALGRVLAEDIQSPVDVPGFDRSNVDGWAVRAADTFGATEHAPVAEVGEGIVTATVRTPPGAILGLIYNPHFSLG